MQNIIDKMRGWLTCLVVFALMVMTPFQEPQIALASDYVEELQWGQMEHPLLESNSAEWHLEQLSDRSNEQNDLMKIAEEDMRITSAEDTKVVATESLEEQKEKVEEITSPLEEVTEPVEEKEPVVRQKKQIPMPQWRIEITSEQLELLERCVMAEGGGESYECQIAIACVIINRVLSDDYPNTVDGVIQQKGQFSTWPYVIGNTTPSNEVKQAVREALTSEHIPENVLFFRANRYHRWGNRYCRMDNTYFSTP